MKSHLQQWSLSNLQQYRELIDPSPEYQRYAVWTRSQQQLLMDSVFRGFDIPKLYLRATPGDGPFEFEAVDGQQRLRAIWDFFGGDFALSEEATPELGGKKYSDLGFAERRVFDLYQLSLVVIEEASGEMIREMFCRLQNGKSLNSAEKRNAMVSGMRDFCADLADHDFFDSVRFGNKRMQYQQVAAQTVLLELAGEPAACRNTTLGKMYKEERGFAANSARGKKVRKVYDFLRRAFPERTPELKSGNVVSIYLLISRLMEGYNMNGREQAVRDFLIDFEARRRRGQDDNEMLRFGERMKNNSDSKEAVAFRHEVLTREFHRFCADLIPLDPTRGFSEEQRVAIYRRDGGRCRECGDAVPFESFEADHVLPHVHGGPTTTVNGRLTCLTCNRKKGATAPVG